MNILQAQNNKKEQLIDLYLPKEVDIAVNLIHTFIKNIGKDMTNILGLKLSIILSGARSQIKYDKDNRVKFEVDELCNICKINRRQLSFQIKKVIATSYHFIDINGDIVGTTPIHTYRYTRRTACSHTYIRTGLMRVGHAGGHAAAAARRAGSGRGRG